MTSPLPYGAIQAALHRAGFDQDAAEYHGALCGALCVRAPADIEPVSLFEREPATVTLDDRQALEALRDLAAVRLADAEGGVQLLLPDDDASLMERAQALGAWCEGFLYGLASSGGQKLNKASEEAREIIADLTQFTRASYDDADALEIEEQAYAELVEYVRVGVQLLFVELSPRPVQTRAH